MKENQILIIRKEPGQDPELEPLFENSLEALQKAVGGYIETVTLFARTTVICNEEARLESLPFNCRVCGVDFYGPVLIVGTRGENFCSIPASEIPGWMKLLTDGRLYEEYAKAEKLIEAHRRDLTAQQYSILRGQLRDGQTDAALKGLGKLLRRMQDGKTV